jgi:hypothetical protein
MSSSKDDPDIVLHATGWDHLQVLKPSQGAKYAITGFESQVVTVKLEEGEEALAEPVRFFELHSIVSLSRERSHPLFARL